MATTGLEILAAKQDIAEAIYRYCRGLDRIDDDLANSAFHPGASVEYGGGIYSGSATGFVDMVAQTHRGMSISHHQLGNMLINIQGETARSETYITVTLHQRQQDGVLAQIHGIGRYLDRWEFREGAWKIVDRLYVHSIDERRPVTVNQFGVTATRDKNDLSYGYVQ